MPRRLTLRSEQLTELTTDELHAVAGGRPVLPTDYCTGWYPSINSPCPTTDCFVITITATTG